MSFIWSASGRKWLSYEVFIRHFVVWKDSKQWKQLTQFSNAKYSQTGSCFSSTCLPMVGCGEKSINCKTSSIYKMLDLHILLTADLAFYIQCRLTLPAILIINVCWLITKEEVENTAGHHVAESSWVSSGLAWGKHHMSFIFHLHHISLLKA